jgi:hypothetical protein
MRSLGAVAAVVVALLTWAALTAAPARADRSFAPRFSATDRGQVLTTGNTVVTCPGTGTSCRAAQAGTSTTTNADFDMDYVDVDSESSTFNSSRATLSLPSGSTVLFAGLYWAGDTSAGSRGSAAPLAAARSVVLLSTPGSGYRLVQAGVLDTDATSTTRYQGFADVTSLVATPATARTRSAASRPAQARTATAGGASSSCTETPPSRPAGCSSTTASSRCSRACGRPPTSPLGLRDARLGHGHRPPPDSSPGRGTAASPATPRRWPAARSATPPTRSRTSSTRAPRAPAPR